MLIFLRILNIFENFRVVGYSFLLRGLVIGLFFLVAYDVNASPCDGVDRNLNSARKLELTSKIAKELHVSSVDVLQSFKSQEWDIVYVATHESDETFLFYPNDPMTSHYITSWAGASGVSEEQQTKEWVLKNAPHIPLKLANCFAWHVTHDRDM